MSDLDIINQDTQLAGAVYPFIPEQRDWAVVSYDVDLFGSPSTQFDSQPVLRWINGSQVKDLYVRGVETTGELGDLTGLSFHLPQGGYVLSKRISRLFRPYYGAAFLDADTVDVRYLEQTEREAKQWDGAGRISRALLLRLIDHLPDELPPRKRDEMIHELRHAKRVEFTMMGKGHSDTTQGGQDKGHACVVDDLDVDLEIPKDTKPGVRLTTDQVFIGIVPVHAHRDSMRLDWQSLINLHPFIQQDALQRYLQEEGQLFLSNVETGHPNPAMQRIDPYTTHSDLQTWHIREYLASGGHPMWFRHVAGSLVNQHIRRIRRQSDPDNKLRFPCPGGRYYVMVDAIGEKQVPYGQVELDPDSATAWVNRQQWADSLADIWGGADQDDALWVYPFADAADGGTHKLLCWRSPNQPGEYVVLEPAPDSYEISWETTGEPIRWPVADSRNLPERIDRSNTHYRQVIDESTAGGLGEGQPYSIDLMQHTVERAVQNRAVLGCFCNLLMVLKGATGTLPETLPDRLERVIDGSVKDGYDLTPVMHAIYERTSQLLEDGQPIPETLVSRLTIDYERDRPYPDPIFTEDHWIDRLLAMTDEHIDRIETQRDALCERAMPPVKLFQYVQEHPATNRLLQQGRAFNALYTRTLLQRDSLEKAREVCETHLECHPDAESVLLAALVSHYQSPGQRTSDASCWQPGEKREGAGRHPGVAQITLDALRRAGLLDGLADNPTHGGVYRYPVATTHLAETRPITLNGVWFNWLREEYHRRDETLPDHMADVDPDEEKRVKTELVQRACSGYLNTIDLVIQERNDRLVAMYKGKLFGYVDRRSELYVMPGDDLQAHYTTARNGNVTLIPKYRTEH